MKTKEGYQEGINGVTQANTLSPYHTLMTPCLTPSNIEKLFK
ncbi:MAG TPA: hypothetical protein VKN74_04870 [Candidatus Mcinerneyibacterium sp.]|nr:hypothetical protein [Candidatus Mcinerneyibacterium sp.]